MDLMEMIHNMELIDTLFLRNLIILKCDWLIRSQANHRQKPDKAEPFPLSYGVNVQGVTKIIITNYMIELADLIGPGRSPCATDLFGDSSMNLRLSCWMAILDV